MVARRAVRSRRAARPPARRCARAASWKPTSSQNLADRPGGSRRARRRCASGSAAPQLAVALRVGRGARSAVRHAPPSLMTNSVCSVGAPEAGLPVDDAVVALQALALLRAARSTLSRSGTDCPRARDDALVFAAGNAGGGTRSKVERTTAPGRSLRPVARLPAARRSPAGSDRTSPRSRCRRRSTTVTMAPRSSARGAAAEPRPAAPRGARRAPGRVAATRSRPRGAMSRKRILDVLVTCEACVPSAAALQAVAASTGAGFPPDGLSLLLRANRLAPTSRGDVSRQRKGKSGRGAPCQDTA